MPRNNLKAAREKAGYNQSQFANAVGVRRQTVSEWETQDREIYPYYVDKIVGVLGNDPHLLDIEPLKRLATEETQETRETGPLVIPQSSLAQPCYPETNRGILESSDYHSIYILGSVRGLKEFMELVRRQFIEALAKLGGIASFGNVSLALVSAPTVDPEEYLSQCSFTLDACWEWLSQGRFCKVEEVLSKNVPVLKRLAYTIFPFQGMAASLAVQAKIMQIILAMHRLDFVGREADCVEAVQFGQLSGNPFLLAAALFWQGTTYISCYPYPQNTIRILSDTLSDLGSEISPLIRSTIYSALSIAYAQDETQEDYETKAQEFAGLAHMTMPDYPELDPFYRCFDMGRSELDQWTGRMYLALAGKLSNDLYAEDAFEAFKKANSKQNMTARWSSQTLIHKADAARALGGLCDFVESLEEGMRIATQINSMKRMSEASDVLQRIPDNWKHIRAVQNLQKDISQALVVARR